MPNWFCQAGPRALFGGSIYFHVSRLDWDISGVLDMPRVAVRSCCRQRVLIRGAGLVSQGTKLAGQRPAYGMAGRWPVDAASARPAGVGGLGRCFRCWIRACRLLVWRNSAGWGSGPVARWRRQGAAIRPRLTGRSRSACGAGWLCLILVEELSTRRGSITLR
jgi:hypothetical protein